MALTHPTECIVVRVLPAGSCGAVSWAAPFYGVRARLRFALVVAAFTFIVLLWCLIKFPKVRHG
jgi:hypothetical protein